MGIVAIGWYNNKSVFNAYDNNNAVIYEVVEYGIKEDMVKNVNLSVVYVAKSNFKFKSVYNAYDNNNAVIYAVVEYGIKEDMVKNVDFSLL